MKQESRPLQAALWMTGAIVSLSSLAISGRALAAELDSFEMMMYRSLIGLVIVLAVGLGTRKLREVRTKRLALHFGRNLAHFIAQNLWFTALPLITLAQVFALEFTSPIWVVIFAILFLGERMTAPRILAIVLGFLGVVFVVRPGFGGDPFGLTLAAVSAIGFALSIVTTRLLTRTETILGVLFWLTLMQSAMGIVAVGWDTDVAWPSLAAWPWVLMLGLAGLFAHYCLTKALALAPATFVAPIDFARLPLIAIVGTMFYAEPLDMFVLIGAALIFAGIYMNILGDARYNHNA